MVLELIATCVIGVGVLYTPPPEWTVQRVTFRGTQDVCTYQKGTNYGWCNAVVVTPISQNAVTIMKRVQIGDKVQAPEGCELMMEMKESKD